MRQSLPSAAPRSMAGWTPERWKQLQNTKKHEPVDGVQPKNPVFGVLALQPTWQNPLLAMLHPYWTR